MLNKISIAIFSVMTIAIISCNSNKDKANNNASGVTNPATTSSPTSELAALESKLRDDSLNIPIRSKVAAHYYSAGDLKVAAYHLSLIYHLDSTNIFALKNLGNIFYDSQQNENAILFYEKALAVEPNNIDLRCDLATCYSRINKPKKAIAILNENIKNNFNHRQSHYNLSVILKQTGKTKDAEKEMKIYNSLNGDKK